MGKYKITDAVKNKQLIGDEISMTRITKTKTKKPNKPTNPANMSGYATIKYVDKRFNELDRKFNKLEGDVNNKFTNINLQLERIIKMINK